MKKIIPLSNLTVDQKCKIASLSVNSALRHRLVDLGFTENSSVECVLKNSHGDLSAYLVCGSIIALRIEDASQISVSV